MSLPRSSSEPDAERAQRLLADGAIGQFVRDGRWDDALSKLNEGREAAPRDAAFGEAIRIVRERALARGLERLGSLTAIPTRTGAAPALDADERYLLGLVTGTVMIDEVLDASTLGRYRTVRGLCGLLDLGVIQTEPITRQFAPVEAAATVKHVVVADGHASSAAITRTMLRLVLGGGARLETVTTAEQLATYGARQRPDLLVSELTLVGGDALAAMRSLRRSLGQLTPTLLIASRLELELATSRAPERAVVIARPIEKAALVGALASLGFAGKS